MPERLQLQRKLGWRKPDGAIIVARPHSRYKNPHRVGQNDQGWTVVPGIPGRGTVLVATRAEAHDVAVQWYREDFEAGRLGFTIEDVRRDLAGNDLLCWCGALLACHADVLLEVANE